MMTRRQRLERRLERRQEWAGKAEARSSAAFATAHERAQAIPFGQPILVGHHSERRDRNYREKIRAGMDRGVQESKLAKHHASKASGLAIALESSIYDDDPDAIEKLREKVAGLEASRETMKAANKAWKAKGRAGVVELLGEEAASAALRRAGLIAESRPFPAYALTNTGSEIRRCRKRIELIERKRARAGEAEESGGLTVKRFDDIGWCRITFAEKPERSILLALRSAGYRWGDGSWQGKLEKLPPEVEALEEEAKAVAGECLCSTADAYECVACERDREAAESEDEQRRAECVASGRHAKGTDGDEACEACGQEVES